MILHGSCDVSLTHIVSADRFRMFMGTTDYFFTSPPASETWKGRVTTLHINIVGSKPIKNVMEVLPFN